MTTRCDFTDLPTDSCAHCLGHADPEQQARKDRTRLISTGRWFAAQYSGTCEACGTPFPPGTAIRMDIPQGWRAECCAEGER